jgi:hypothetical protein
MDQSPYRTMIPNVQAPYSFTEENTMSRHFETFCEFGFLTMIFVQFAFLFQG